MTALTALRTNFKETSDRRNVPAETVLRQQQQFRRRQRIIEETYPELSLKQQKKHKVKLPSLPATIEDASEDEESRKTNNCTFSAGTISERSPYVLPPEELFGRNLSGNQNFLSHPLISPKFERRPLRQLPVKITTGLSRGFNDTSLGERLSGANYDSIPADFLDLPPIPETVSIRKKSERKGANSDEEEKVDEEIFEIAISDSFTSS
uniref:Uncharacterized protein n=1 Tax=Setaria digitata TaxID=48799 RepID=A0A915PXI1_9BILA